MHEANEQIYNAIKEMGEINLDTVNFYDIEKLLMRNLSILGNVKKVWEKLMRSFQKIAIIIKFTMEENVEKFVNDARKIQQRAIEYKLSDKHGNHLYQIANNAIKLAFVDSNLSDMYCEISDDHIMDQVASLGQLMDFDPEFQRKVKQDKHRELEQQAKNACSSIKDRVTKRITAMKIAVPVVEENPKVRAAIDEEIAESNQIKAEIQKQEK